MNNLMQHIIALALALTPIAGAHAQDTVDSAAKYPDYQEDVFMDMDFDTNIATPAAASGIKKEVVKHQRKLAEQFKDRYTVDLMRDGEVVIVSVPTDALFLPNDTLFCKEAAGQLTPLLAPMADPYMYKIIVAIHTDDTGSESYREHLSDERIRTVYDWMMNEIDRGVISEDLVIVPYSMGSTMPLVPNDTRRHRKENRRLEIYYIPGPELLSRAAAHTLK